LIFSDLVKFKDSIPLLKEEHTKYKQELFKLQAQIDIYKEQQGVEIDEKKEVADTFTLQNYNEELFLVNGKKQEQEKERKVLEECDRVLDVRLVEVEDITEDLEEYKARKIKGELLIVSSQKDIDKLRKRKGYSTCPFCEAKITSVEGELKEKEEYKKKLTDTLKTVNTKIQDLVQKRSAYTTYTKLKEKRGQVQQVKDSNTFSDVLLASLSARGQELIKLETAQVAKAKEVQLIREKAIQHNAKIDAQMAQATKAATELEKSEKTYKELAEKEDQVKLLIKICEEVILTKQIPKRLTILESFINSELANFTSQYKIVLKMEKDKISRSIIKEDKTYPIENLSTGEKARINLALIFAIRSILNKLHKQIYNINLLFIDEVLSSLDYSGKHLLLNSMETYNINTFLVTHDYTFSDIPNLFLIKKDNKTVIKNAN